MIAVICLVPLVISAAAMWVATILLYRKGHKELGIGMGVISGLYSMTMLCLGFAVILAGLPGVQPDMYPTPIFDFIPAS